MNELTQEIIVRRTEPAESLSLGDALIKMTSGNFVLWQIFVLRSAIAIPCLLVFMVVFGRYIVCGSWRFGNVHYRLGYG